MNRAICFVIILAVFVVSSGAFTGSAESPNLSPDAVVNVATVPAGACIYINSKFIGKTPLDDLALLPGKYRIRADWYGYPKTDVYVELTTGEKRELEFHLAGEPPRKTGSKFGPTMLGLVAGFFAVPVVMGIIYGINHLG